MLTSGLSHQAEQRAQDRAITRMAQRAERQIAREIARAMTAAGRLVAKGEPMAADMVLATHKKTMTRILDALWTAAADNAANRFVNLLKSHERYEYKQDELDRDLLPDADEIDRLIAEWVRVNGGAQITQITEKTKNDIVALINDGFREGLTNAEIGERIARVAPTKSASRAQTIARTEAHRSSQSVSLEMGKTTETQMVKIWLAADNDRTRGRNDGDQWDHWGANDQTVAADQPFEIENLQTGAIEQLDYPGDPSGSAGNVINCRCVLGWELV